MTPNDYWYGSLSLTRAYMKMARIKAERSNFDAWLQGAYIYNAFATVMANAFSKQKHDYLSEPFKLSGDNKENKKKDKCATAAELFKGLAIAHNQRMAGADNGE